MEIKEVLQELESMGNESTKKIYLKHGITEPMFGVKVADLKKILKKTKVNHKLALELFKTKNHDAMYLAGLMADENLISKKDLENWAKSASNYSLREYTVAWLCSESKFGYDLALKWIKSKDEAIATIGWSTLSSLASFKDDAELDLKKYEELLTKVEKEIANAPNRVRYTMNGFVIAVGSYITSLNKKASNVAKNIGKVEVTMGETACKVPLASAYIKKVVDKGRLGKKRKQARC